MDRSMVTLDEFINVGKDDTKLDEAAQKVYSTDMDEAAKARETFWKLFKAAFPGAQNFNYNDPAERGLVEAALGNLRGAYQEADVSYMRDHAVRDALLNDVGNDRLANFALLSPPTKTGDAARDEIVKAHEKVVEAQENLRKGAENYNAVAKEIITGIYDEVKKSLDGNARYAHLTQDERGARAQAIANLARNQNYGLRILNAAADKASEKFDEKFANDGARAQYARENYVARSTMGANPDELRQNQYSAAKSLQLLASQK